MINLVDLTGKTILVTGASSGMGRETAILCSKLGAKLILVARREDKLKEVCSELEGCGHKIFTCDLSDVDGIEKFVSEVISECGPLDGFVHSAGVGNTRPLKLLKPAALLAVLNINYCSFIEIVRCITKRDCFNKGLSIVGISSTASKIGNQTKTAYCASKAAMDASVRCIAKELAKNGVRANTVCPSFINTDIYQQYIDTSMESEDAKMNLARQYLGVGEPIDVANMIAFLLSDASKFITGTSINVDGGKLSS